MAEAAVAPYEIAATRHDLVIHDAGMRVGYWRAVSHNMNAFANESFIDECAAAAGQDPVKYRLSLLTNQPRFANVLKAAAEKSGWGTPVAGRSRGVALMEGYDTYMTSQPGLPPASAGARLDQVLARRPRQIAYGGGGATTRLVCGYLACDARLAKMLLAGLPRIVRVNVRGSNAGAWLEASVRYALAEARSPRPGGAGVLAKLAEVLFIEVLRLYMPPEN